MLPSTGSRCTGISSCDTQSLELRLSSYSTWLSSPTAEGIKVKIAQSCLTLCDPMDYTVHGILQARILEWVAFPWEKAMAPHSSTLAWKILWMEEPGRLQSMGSLGAGHD